MLGSAIIAVWTRWIDPVINQDGVKYVLAASDFLAGKYQAGIEAYKWPFYSMTVALLSKLTAMSTETSAIVFNAVMRGIGGIAFIRLTRIFGANKTQLWLAAFIYLFFPGLNEVQSMIIRDFAYLGCFLWMVVFYIQYRAQPNTQDLILFIVLGLLATAFRIEGAIYLFFALTGILISAKKSTQWRIKSLAGIVLILPALVYGALYWLYDGNLQGAWEVLQRLMARSRAELEASIAALQPGVLSAVLEKAFVPVLVLSPIAKMLYNVLEILTLGYVLILVFGLFKRPWIDTEKLQRTRVLQSWRDIILINLLILIFFAQIRSIFTDRYPLSLALLIMLFLPFVITALFRSAASKNGRKVPGVAIAAVIVLALNAVEGLDRKSSKRHLKEAGQWIKQQSDGVYHKSKIYSNDRIVDYYAGQKVARPDNHYSIYISSQLTLSMRWKRLDFMAIHLNRHGKPGFYRNFRFRIGKEPDKIFRNRKGDQVLVYDFTSD